LGAGASRAGDGTQGSVPTFGKRFTGWKPVPQEITKVHRLETCATGDHQGSQVGNLCHRESQKDHRLETCATGDHQGSQVGNLCHRRSQRFTGWKPVPQGITKGSQVGKQCNRESRPHTPKKAPARSKDRAGACVYQGQVVAGLRVSPPSRIASDPQRLR